MLFISVLLPLVLIAYPLLLNKSFMLEKSCVATCTLYPATHKLKPLLDFIQASKTTSVLCWHLLLLSLGGCHHMPLFHSQAFLYCCAGTIDRHSGVAQCVAAVPETLARHPGFAAVHRPESHQRNQLLLDQSGRGLGQQPGYHYRVYI